MNNEGMLAQLAAQAAAQGAELVTVRALIEEASEAGAARVLERIGLGDLDAGKDIGALREMLRAWRDAKRSATKSAIGWIVRAVLALVMMALAWRFGADAAGRA